MFKNLKIKVKLLGAFLIVSLIPLALVTYLALSRAGHALQNEVIAKFTSVQEIKIKHLEDYFRTATTALKIAKDDPHLYETLRALQDAFESNEKSLENNDHWQILADLRGLRIKDVIETNGWRDLYLISLDGDIIYTVTRGADLGLNIPASKLSGTNLGKALEAIRNAQDNDIVLVDYEPYAPAGGQQVAFMAARMKSLEGRIIGYVAVQLTTTEVNAIVQQRSGMGETAESYLVGGWNGKTSLRSDRVIKKGNIGEEETDRFVEMALQGKSGTDIKSDSDGDHELVRFDPLKIKGLNWCLITTGSVHEAFSAVSELRNRILLVIAIVIVVVAGTALWIAGLLVKPIMGTAAMLKDIAEGEGDLTRRLPEDRGDEIGDMARWFNVFMIKLQALIRQISQDAGSLNEASATLSAIAAQMSGNAAQMSTRSDQVATSAEEMSQNLGSVAASSEQAAANVNMVASSAEEMTATVREIAQNSEKARTITESAVAQAGSASTKINNLGRAAHDIGKVTEVITDISEQTNLLALNATIEAARAGDAGKGFGVVANEIKELARQTSGATQEIKARVEDIQGSTAATVTEIEQITAVIHQVSEIVSTIATSVEEQAATSQEIANNISQASQGIQDVNQNVNRSSSLSETISTDMAQVNRTVQEVSASSGQINGNAEQLARLAEKLKGLVSRFKV